MADKDPFELEARVEQLEREVRLVKDWQRMASARFDRIDSVLVEMQAEQRRNNSEDKTHRRKMEDGMGRLTDSLERLLTGKSSG